MVAAIALVLYDFFCRRLANDGEDFQLRLMVMVCYSILYREIKVCIKGKVIN